ncbi:glutamate receptor 4-like isoform X3 [Eriocheir sinensis]|uniref:glutamate receptor 4-like isoform X3 n=1 Tax=Eriocheir sinensis TaxID=95602 RepID=UPI0021C95402|nr:glutamate receptor 4-like isoform X3 [Eriocheir sinensis]
MDAGLSHANASCLRVMVFNYFPHMGIIGEGANRKVVGTLMPVLDIIARHVGFCLEFVVNSDNVFGEVLANGSATGTLGAVLDGQVDMTGVLTVTEGRTKHLDFSRHLFLEIMQVAVKRPVLEPDVAGFVKPFTSWVWLSIVVAMLLTALACTLLLTVWRSPTSDTPHRERDCGCGGEASLGSTLPPLLWCLAVLLSRGTTWVYKTVSLRVIASVWFLASFILSTVYSSNLKAMLITPRVQLPFDNLEELDKSQYPLYLIETSATHTAISAAADDSPLGRLKDQVVTMQDELEIARLFYAGNRMSIAGLSISFRHFMNHAFSRNGFCTEYVMQGDRLMEGLSQALGFPKGSRLRPRVDDVILRLREAGIINYLLYRAMPNSSLCLGPIDQAPSSNKLRAQTLQDFYGVFFIFIGGNFLAAVAFAAEMLTRRRNNTTSDQ